MPDPSLVAEKTGPGGFQRSASLGAVQPYAGCVGRHGHAWRVVMPILRQSYANPVAASESDLVRVRVRVGGSCQGLGEGEEEGEGEGEGEWSRSGFGLARLRVAAPSRGPARAPSSAAGW